MSRGTRKMTMELLHAALMEMTSPVLLPVMLRGELGTLIEKEVDADGVVGEGGKTTARCSLDFEKCPKGVSGRLSSSSWGRDNERGSESGSIGYL
jgi:hypothetical protein